MSNRTAERFAGLSRPRRGANAPTTAPATAPHAVPIRSLLRCIIGQSHYLAYGRAPQAKSVTGSVPPDAKIYLVYFQIDPSEMGALARIAVPE